MDLSSTKDLTALVAVFPDDDGFDVLCQFFCPKEQIRERSNRDRVPYEQWANSKEKWLIATDGPVVDYGAIRKQLHDWDAEFDIQDIAYDPWNATQLVTQLSEEDGFTCVAIRQGFASLSAPTKALEAHIIGQTLRHDGNPILRWNISNIAVETDAAGNLKISKKVSTERIDGGAALVNAVDRLERNGPPKEPTFQMLILGQR
jgi:phage terminase large subunit-like protein